MGRRKRKAYYNQQRQVQARPQQPTSSYVYDPWRTSESAINQSYNDDSYDWDAIHYDDYDDAYYEAYSPHCYYEPYQSPVPSDDDKGGGGGVLSRLFRYSMYGVGAWALWKLVQGAYEAIPEDGGGGSCGSSVGAGKVSVKLNDVVALGAGAYLMWQLLRGTYRVVKVTLSELFSYTLVRYTVYVGCALWMFKVISQPD